MAGSAVSPHQADKVFRRIRKRKRYFPVRRSLTLSLEVSESPGPEQDAHALLKLFAIEWLPFFDRKHAAQHLFVILGYSGKIDSFDESADAASLRPRHLLGAFGLSVAGLLGLRLRPHSSR